MAGGAAFWASVEFLGPTRDTAVVEATAHSRERPRVSALPSSYTQTAMPEAAPPSRLDADARNNPFAQLNLRPPGQASLGAPAVTKPVAAPVKAKPAADPPPEPPPMAPALPFTVIGSIEGADATSGQPIAFLQQQNTLFVVRAGESIGQLYRVESVSSEKVEFTYLPLNQRQSLSFAR